MDASTRTNVPSAGAEAPRSRPRPVATGWRRLRPACALTLIAALAGCAGTPQKEGPGEPAGDDAARAPLATDGVVEHQVDNRAVALLWDDAEQARRAGDLDAAVASLERAVNVAPDDPVLWSRLAELRLRQAEYAVAENLAAKSNALAGDRRLLRYRNWLIVLEARSRRGDRKGAQEARNEAERLRGGGDDSG